MFESTVLLQAPFDMKEFFTVNAEIIFLVVSPVVTLLRCRNLLVGDAGFTKADGTPPPTSVFRYVFPIFDVGICGVEMCF